MFENATKFLPLLLVAFLASACGPSEDEAMQLDDGDFKEALRKSMEEFENRTIYTSLDPDIIASIPDGKLEQAIIDYINSKIGDDWDNRRDIVDSMPESFRGVFATWWLEAEVNNGGFNQYFWNPYGYWAEDAISAFDEYRAYEYAEVTKKAVAMFLAEVETHKEFRELGTLEAFSESYDHTELGDLDNEFWDVGQDLSRIRVAYIRENPEKFTGN